MSMALSTGGELGEVAKLWAEMRNNGPLFGYPDVEEAEEQLLKFLAEGEK